MDNIIKAEDYKGTSIYDTLVSDGKNEEIIRETIANNLRKGVITQEQFTKANAQLDELVKGGKKTGAGSRGGHVIGYTKSGKPVYKSNKAGDYKNFSAQDHTDAAKFHADELQNNRTKMFHTSGIPEHKRFALAAMNEHHEKTHSEHNAAAHSQIQKEHESGLSSDEKKIIATQKKKQIDHHSKMHEFHSSILKHIGSKEYPDSGSDLGRAMLSEHKRHSELADHHKSEKERLEKE